jgi:hypothetical protein
MVFSIHDPESRGIHREAGRAGRESERGREGMGVH